MQESISILLDTSGKDMLRVAYAGVVENIQKTTISAALKNMNLSGDPVAGSVEARRITNTASAAYGTARAAGKGTLVSVKPVVVSIDQRRELINEVNDTDVKLYSVQDLIARKSAQDEMSMRRELERAFFTEAITAGTAATLTETAIEKKVEQLIQLVENTSNKWVDGVERDKITIVCNTATYGAIRDYLDKTSAPNVKTDKAYFEKFHGVQIKDSVFLPAKTQMIAMVEESIAQPVLVTMDEPGKFPASEDYHFGLFYSYGTKAVMPDLIYKVVTV